MSNEYKKDTKEAKPSKKWLDKYDISHEDHIPGLEVRAAVAEWHDKLPRFEAEAKAHADYTKEELENAAAHHFSGVHAAHAAGDTESAKKHGVMYLLAMKALGHKDVLNPPPEVQNKAKNSPSKVYKFKNHISDQFLLQGDKGSTNED